nr:nuclear transport factor 2 family protein [Thioclava sp. F42-5]
MTAMLARKDRLDEIDGLFDADALTKGPISGLEIRPEVFGERVPALRAHLHGIQIAVLRHVESGDWLWTLLKVAGKSAQTARSLEFTGQLAMRFRGEKIVESYNTHDVIALL